MREQNTPPGCLLQDVLTPERCSLVQIGKLHIKVQFQSVSDAVIVAPPAPPTLWQTWRQRADEKLRWLIDIDDGAGAAVCVLGVLIIFGILTVRLFQLNSTLSYESMTCKAMDKTSLSVECRFN